MIPHILTMIPGLGSDVRSVVSLPIDESSMFRVQTNWGHTRNLPACRRVLWILLVRSCTVCFVFVLSPLARIFASSNLNPTPPPARLPPSFIFPYVVVGSTLPTPRSTPAWFCICCCHFDGCFRFFVFATGLLRRFLYPILDPLAFVPNTIYTQNLSKYDLFQSLSQYGFFHNPDFTNMLWLKLNPWLERNQCFCVKTVFYTKSCFTQKPSYAQTHCYTQKSFLLGLCKGCLRLTG